MINDWIEFAKAYAEEIRAAIALVLLVLSVVGIILPGVRARGERIRRDLEHERGRNFWLGRLGGTDTRWRGRYIWSIRRVRTLLYDRLGPPLSLLLFLRCLTLAFGYPVVLFWIAWLAGGSGSIAGSLLLADATTFFDRLWRLVVVLIFSLLVVVYLRRCSIQLSDPLLAVDRTRQQSYIKMIVTFRSVIANGVFALLSSLAAAIAALNLLGARNITGDFVGVLAAAAIAFAIGNAAVGAIVGRADSRRIAIVVGGPLLVALVLASTSGTSFVPVPALVLLFFVLPITNAIPDWLSWSATQVFLHRVSLIKQGWWGTLFLAGAILINILFAIGCLLLLAALIPNMIELVNAVYQAFNLPVVNWVSSAKQATERPWTVGLMVSGMLITTLIPTILHLSLGLYAVFTAWSPFNRNAISLLKEDKILIMSEQDIILSAISRSRLWIFPALIIAISLFVILIVIYNLTISSIGQLLLEVAYCSTVWAGNRCTAW